MRAISKIDVDYEGYRIVKGKSYPVRWIEHRGTNKRRKAKKKVLVMVDTLDGSVGGLYLNRECDIEFEPWEGKRCLRCVAEGRLARCMKAKRCLRRSKSHA